MVYRQVQDWTKSLENSAGAERGVIGERPVKVRAISPDGIRHDTAVIAVVALLVLFIGILLPDLASLVSTGSSIGKLSSSVEKLEQKNDWLREELILTAGKATLIPRKGVDQQITQTILMSVPDSPEVLLAGGPER